MIVDFPKSTRPAATSFDPVRRLVCALTFLITGNWATASVAQSVCATVPELGSLAREIGGDAVTLTVFAKGSQDPHFVEARPTFIRSLNQADAVIQVGLGMEAGWMPPLLRNSRNSRIAFGSPGFIDASTAVQPMQVPAGAVDRSMGDVHGQGNPHYLVDPLNGLRVARLLRDRFCALRPAESARFTARYDDFAGRVATALVGEPLAKKYGVDGVEKLSVLFERGELPRFLKSQGEDQLLGGWLGALAPHHGAKVVDDHNMWPYFARRFGVTVAAHLEPKPGLPPTTAHLATVVEQMRRERIRVILANAYYDPRHAQFVARRAEAVVAHMAHQVGARPDTDDYLAMLNYNVRQLASALGETK